MRCRSCVLHAARYEHSSVKLTELAGREVGAHAPCASFRIAFAAQHGPCQNAHAPEGTGAAAYGRIFGRLRRSASGAASRSVVPGSGRRLSAHVHVAEHPGCSNKLVEYRKGKYDLFRVFVLDPNKTLLVGRYYDLLPHWRPPVSLKLSRKASHARIRVDVRLYDVSALVWGFTGVPYCIQQC